MKVGSYDLDGAEKNAQYFTTRQIDSLTEQYAAVLSKVQLDFLRYNLSEGSARKNYWLYSEYASGKNILLLSPHSGNPHFDENYYYLKIPCDYIILLHEKRRRKDLKKISRNSVLDGIA